jgi:hypothetical protein
MGFAEASPLDNVFRGSRFEVRGSRFKVQGERGSVARGREAIQMFRAACHFGNRLFSSREKQVYSVALRYTMVG